MKKIKNIHCFLSPILNESRVMKETNSLIQLKLIDEIRIIGYWQTGIKKNEKIDEGREIVRLTTIAKRFPMKYPLIRKIFSLLSIIEINFKYFQQIYNYKPNFISCHNLILLPICSLGKWLTKAKLVYVPHELETEKTGLSRRLKNLNIFIEKNLFKNVDYTIVVCEPIANWYKKEYNSEKVSVLRNVPYNFYADKPVVRSKKLREEFKIPETDIIFIYQGIIDKIRGCAAILEAFKIVSRNRHIVMMGYGQMEEEVIKASLRYRNIHFKKAVPINEIINYTSGADVGIIYLPFDISLSYKYSMPNKFFEYLIGGLPVLVSSNLEYLSNEIEEHNLGWVLDLNQNSLIDFVNSVDSKSIKMKLMKPYADKIGWQNEHEVLKRIYRSD